LIEHGADANSVNTAGENLIKKCIEDDNEDMVNYLLSIGVSLPPAHVSYDEFNGEYIPENDESI